MGKAFRKPRPSPPIWFWYDADGCWFCDNKRNCNQCKMCKIYVADQRKRKDRKEKTRLRKEGDLDG